jgi:hypothetical protein
MKECAQPDCTKSFWSSREGTMKAHYSGWYHQRNGKSWCPEHRPAWAPKWEGKK